MKIIIAPDSFGNTLSASQAAQCIAQGWQQVFPNDTLFMLPQSDGGPGFLDVLHARGGKLIETRILDAWGNNCSSYWLQQWTSARASSYIESALACGLAQLSGLPNPTFAREASSYGLGQLVINCLDLFQRERSKSFPQRLDDYPHHMMIGLGGTASSDGGRGFLEALATKPRGYIYGNTGESLSVCTQDFWDEISIRSQEVLYFAGQKLHEISAIKLIAATDVDNLLLGKGGAIGMFSQQKGADPAAKQILEERNMRWAQELAQYSVRDIANMPGSGAGGGLGAAIMAMGGVRISGSELINDLVYGLASQSDIMAEVGLIITGEGRLDAQSLHGKAVSAIVKKYADRRIPVVVIAGQVELSTEIYSTVGISRAYSLSEYAGSVDIAMHDAAALCVTVAERVARDWGAGSIIS